MKHPTTPKTTVTVEFFGIPRDRAGTAKTVVDPGTLGEVLDQLSRHYPRFAESCLQSGGLAKGYVANLNGQRFITDGSILIQPGDALLILSADAGG